MLLSLLAVQLTERFSLHTRSSLYARILDGVWEHRARFHSEDLLSRLTSDVGRVSDGIVTAATSLIATAVQFCLAFGLLCLYDKTIALFTLASVPCIAVLTLLLGLRLKELQVRQQQAEADYRVYLQEQLSAADVVKAFEAEAESCRRFAALQERRIRWSCGATATVLPCASASTPPLSAPTYLPLSPARRKLPQGPSPSAP